jgi:hypothetical protein
MPHSVCRRCRRLPVTRDPSVNDRGAAPVRARDRASGGPSISAVFVRRLQAFKRSQHLDQPASGAQRRKKLRDTAERSLRGGHNASRSSDEPCPFCVMYNFCREPSCPGIPPRSVCEPPCSFGRSFMSSERTPIRFGRQMLLAPLAKSSTLRSHGPIGAS